MVLFHQIGEVFHLSQFHVLRQYSSGFQVGNGLGIGRIFIDSDYTQNKTRKRRTLFPKERFRCCYSTPDFDEIKNFCNTTKR
jgi:hypothetical protein